MATAIITRTDRHSHRPQTIGGVSFPTSRLSNNPLHFLPPSSSRGRLRAAAAEVGAAQVAANRPQSALQRSFHPVNAQEARAPFLRAVLVYAAMPRAVGALQSLPFSLPMR